MIIRNKVTLLGLFVVLFMATFSHAAIIIQHPTDQKAVEGAAVQFSVVAEGQDISYQWLKDGVEIDGATSAQYAIDIVSMQENESWYRCRVTSDTITRTSLEAQLVVYQKGDYDWDRDIDRDDLVHLQHHIGKPHRKSWMKKSTGRDAKLKHGKWNKFGKKEETLPAELLEFDWNSDNRITGWDLQILKGYCTNSGCEVIEAEPPVIVQQPAPVTMSEGMYQLLWVGAEGPNLHYQWQKNAEDIPGAHFPWLWLESVSIDDDGSRYRCIITNDDGVAMTREVLLSIYRRADLDRDGDIDGHDIAKIRKYLRKPAFWGKQCDLDFNHHITWKDLQIAENQCDAPGCDNANLTPPEIVRQPHDLSVVAGQPAVFKIAVAGSNIGYQWLRDGVEIADATSSSLHIDETTHDDDGATFQCRITSDGESLLSKEVTLRVFRQGDFDWDGDIDEADIRVVRALLWKHAFWTNVEADFDGDRWITLNDLRHLIRLCTCPQCEEPQPPIITGEPEDLVVLEKEPATFTVEATGLRLTYQWQVDGVDIPDADENSYTLPAAELLDHGKLYRCIITNAAGSVVSRETELQVEMDVPPNEVEVTGVQAVWQQDKAAVSWQPVEGMRYQIHRGRSGDETQLIGESADIGFLDDGAAYYFGWFYRVAAIKDYFHPVSNKAYHAVGPLSSPVELRAQPSPTVQLNDLQLQDDGSYLAYFIDGKTVAGSYRNMQDPVTVTASGPSTFTATGADGAFSLAFPAPGDWLISIEETDGYRAATARVSLQSDTTAPSLVLHSGLQLTTTSASIGLSGEATDTESGLQAISVTSDRYANSFGSGFDAQGLFFIQVPVKPGENRLKVTVEDRSGNSTTTTVVVEATVPALPQLSISNPANGATLTAETVDVTGTVRSSLAPEKIQLSCNGQVDFPTGQDGEYTFTFPDHRLREGTNTIMVTAQTPYGSVSEQVIVVQAVQEEPVVEEQPPEVVIYSAKPDDYITESSFIINGMATGSATISSVVINGKPATITGSGSEISFAATLAFEGNPQLDIQLVVTDSNGQSTTLQYTVYHDDGPPLIDLTGKSLLAPPAVNSVLQTPWTLSGSVSDSNLAGFSINDQPVGLLPAASGVHSFAVDLDLIRDEEMFFTLKAWDMAGNVASKAVALRLDSGVAIEVIAPAAGAELRTDADTILLEMTARVSGQADSDLLIVTIDEQPVSNLNSVNGHLHGTAELQLADGSHVMAVEVRTPDNVLLARTVREFKVVDSRLLPVDLVGQEPANNATGVKNNGFIALYFNKSIDPSRLEIEVRETYHGPDYAGTADGADMTGLSKVDMVEVHRDLELVAGGISHFPEQTMAAFYPSRNFAFGAQVYVRVSYDGQELASSRFSVKPLPTFVQGFVADQFSDPIAEITVTIPELNRTVTTDKEGSYSLGFGDPADKQIPAGRYLAIANPGLANSLFGTSSFWITVESGRLNESGIATIPVLNRAEPFRLAASGMEEVLLAGGELELDLQQAELEFADGSDAGSVHGQFLGITEQPYRFIPAAAPQWVFNLNPAGVKVNGQVGVRIKMPAMAGSHDYVQYIGERVVLVGLDDRSLQIVPVGVGKVDPELSVVTSEGRTAFQRLDIVGYGLVDPEKQDFLRAYAKEELSLTELINRLGN